MKCFLILAFSALISATILPLEARSPEAEAAVPAERSLEFEAAALEARSLVADADPIEKRELCNTPYVRPVVYFSCSI